jgi:hypothetical protein
VTGTAGAISPPPVFSEAYNELSASQALYARGFVASSVAATLANQSLVLSYFTAVRSFTTSQIVLPNGTAAGATPTLVRVGLYSVDAAGAGTLIGSFANDTTLFAVANSLTTKNWTTPIPLVMGQRYAAGFLCVTAAAAPTIAGQLFIGGAAAFASRMGRPPRLTGALAGQADLPANFADASLTNFGGRAWAELLP